MANRSTYERGNQRLLRLAAIIDKVAQGTPHRRIPTGSCAISWWAAFNPARWTTLNGYNGRRKWVRLNGSIPTSLKSAMLDFALRQDEAKKLFGNYGWNSPTSLQLRLFVIRRRSTSYPWYVPPTALR